MFEKLLELLVSAKAGAISGVLILSGALVSVTTTGGVTTITLQDQTPTPTATATATPTPTPAATVLVTPTPTPAPTATESPAPTASASPATSCSADAQTIAAARQRVRDAFVQDHTGLMQLRSGEEGRANEAIKRGDEMIKAIAKKADEALRDLGCAKRHDDGNDSDQNEDADENTSVSASATPAPSPAPSPTTSVSDQATQIADNATSAMQTVFNAVQALVANATSSPAVTTQHAHGDGHHGDKRPQQTSSSARHEGGNRD